MDDSEKNRVIQADGNQMAEEIANQYVEGMTIKNPFVHFRRLGLLPKGPGWIVCCTFGCTTTKIQWLLVQKSRIHIKHLIISTCHQLQSFGRYHLVTKHANQEKQETSMSNSDCFMEDEEEIASQPP